MWPAGGSEPQPDPRAVLAATSSCSPTAGPDVPPGHAPQVPGEGTGDGRHVTRAPRKEGRFPFLFLLCSLPTRVPRRPGSNPNTWGTPRALGYQVAARLLTRRPPRAAQPLCSQGHPWASSRLGDAWGALPLRDTTGKRALGRVTVTLFTWTSRPLTETPPLCHSETALWPP